MKTLRRLLLLALLCLATPLPATAAPGDLDPLDVNLVGTYVAATAVQPDGKVIIVGSFTSVLGVPRSNIARINADGTLDTGFDPKANLTVNCVAVQADGKVLFGGSFTTLQPNGAASATPRQAVARVNADGTLDTGFDPKPSSAVMSVAVQADGKVLLGGAFTTLQPNGAASTTARQYVARVNADGTLDTGFNPKANLTVYSVAVQADGKVLLGGTFTSLQPNGAAATPTRQYVARVNADGTLDTGFDPNANNTVYSVAVQADGKVLLGGTFTSLQPNGAASATARGRVARVNADGTLDTGFDPKANSIVYSVALQADGKMLLGGTFTTLQPNGAAAATARQYVARVNADGTMDPGFDPKASDILYDVAVQPDGKVLLGGRFATLQPNGAASAAARNHFARLTNDAAVQTLSATSASRVAWMRSGAAPEVAQVTFEQSTDGTNWTALGSGTRITGGWEATGLSLTGTGQVRARGRTSGGYYNGASGLIEQVTTYSFANTPTVTAPTSTSVTSSGATLGGNVVSDGGAAITGRGVVYAKTALNADPVLGGANVFSLSTSGTTGVFTLPVTGLTSRTGYSFKAYATNAIGMTYSSVATFTTPMTALENWRIQNFGTPENLGNAADGADADGDGLINALELSFGTNPNDGGSGGGALQYGGTFAGGGTILSLGSPRVMSEATGNSTELRALYVRRKDAAAMGLTYSVEFSSPLGAWQASTDTPTVLADDGTYQIVSVPFPAPMTTQPSAFCKVRVTLAP